jgi:hypothetical protein
MSGENIGNARQKMQSQGQRARGNDKVGVNNIRLPDAAYFYVLDFGDGSNPETGYLIISR